MGDVCQVVAVIEASKVALEATEVKWGRGEGREIVCRWVGGKAKG